MQLLFRAVFPESQVRIFCQKKPHMAAIIQILLIENTEMRKKLMKFIANYFVSPKLNLKEYGIVDFLMSCIDDKTGSEAIDLLILIQNATENYNNDLVFKSLSIADQDLINSNDKIKDSIFLRYFPIPFVKFIVEAPSCKLILETYCKNLIEDSALIWTQDMRNQLENTLASHLAPFKKLLGEYVENKSEGFRKIENMPIYSTIFKEIMKYPKIDHEIRCGEYYLRIWNSKKGNTEGIHQPTFFNNLEKTFKEISGDFSKYTLEDFQIVLTSFKFTYFK